MQKRALFILLAAAGITLPAAGSTGLLKNFQADKAAAGESLKVNFDNGVREFTVPMLNAAPDLKNYPAGWENAVKMDQFKVLHRKAISLAKAKQAAGEWQIYVEEMLQPVEPTVLRMAYDQNNLYIAAECSEKNWKRLTQIKGLKRDDAIYSVDSIELLLYPTPASEKYMQLISDVNAQKYDAAVNQTTGHENTKWNPDYQVVTSRKTSAWVICWALPWKMLGVVPEPGKVMAFNAGRNKVSAGHECSSLAWNNSAFNERNRLIKLHLGRKKPQNRILALDAPFFAEGNCQAQLLVANPAQNTCKAVLAVTVNGKAAKKYDFTMLANNSTAVKIELQNIKPAENKIELDLYSVDGKLLTRELIICHAKPVLSAKLTDQALVKNELLNGTVQVNVPEPEKMFLQFEFNNRKASVPAKSGSFALDPGDFTGSGVLKITLCDKKSGKAVYSQQLALSFEEDPFSE